ncbi:MAG: helix-turn-helix domain-containing protein [Actinomycetota bacterium]|nr:helix-turn-helix domain-containing protein [Actinomycetota bacterium]
MAGPTVRRRQLGKQLRQLRTDADETREQTAVVLGCSPTKVTYLESGRNVIGKTELIVLLQHYGAEDKLATLEELRQEAGKRGWWSTARLPEWLAAYVGLETEASSVRSFETTLLPGLLQTESYVREVHRLRGHLSSDDLERRVKARLRRQDRLTSSDPLQLSAVISEEALLRCARQPSVADEQFRQLVNWAQLPNIEIRVLPLDAGLHSGMQGAFTLLSFPEGLLPDAGWQEYALGGHVIDDEADVASLSTLYDELRGQTLGSDESLTRIAELIDNG